MRTHCHSQPPEYPVGEESESARDYREHEQDDQHGHQEPTALRGGPVAGEKEVVLQVEHDGAVIVDRPKHRDKHVEEEHAVAVVIGPENQDEGTEEGPEAETFQSKHVHNRDDNMGCTQQVESELVLFCLWGILGTLATWASH